MVHSVYLYLDVNTDLLIGLNLIMLVRICHSYLVLQLWTPLRLGPGQLGGHATARRSHSLGLHIVHIYI